MIRKITHKNYPDDVIAVKIYGSENQHLFNREKEFDLMEQLHKKDLCPRLYARLVQAKIAFSVCPFNDVKIRYVCMADVRALLSAHMLLVFS